MNLFDPSRLLPRELILVIGTPIMLLRNLKPPRLSEATRLRIMDHIHYTIETIIFWLDQRWLNSINSTNNYDYYGVSIFIWKVGVSCQNVLVIKINTSQSQMFKVSSVVLRSEVNSCGRSYVGLSRNGSLRHQQIKRYSSPMYTEIPVIVFKIKFLEIIKII